MIFNKKTKLLSLSSLAVSLLLSSCIMDTFEDEPEAVKGLSLPKGKYVLSFNIKQVEGTRASGDLVDGTDEDLEHTIILGSNYILYFNDEDVLTEVSELTGTDTHPEEDNIEARYVSTFNVDDDWEVPSKCLVILNGKRFKSKIDAGIGIKKKDEIIQELNDISTTDPYTIGREGDYFTMANSIYYEGNTRIDAVPITAEVIQKEDEPYDPDKAITVRVERMLSKFTFVYENPGDHGQRPELEFTPGKKDEDIIIFTGYDDDGIPQYDLRKWKCIVTGWGMNALETQTDLFRQINNKDYSAATGEGLDFTWSDPTNYRSYWSEDAHYDDGVLPYSWQYRDAIDKKIYGEPVNSYLNYYEDLFSKGTNKLVNYSYNYFENASKDQDFERKVYTPENTYNYNKIKQYLDNRTDVLAGTHLIITAKLKTDWDANDGETFTIKDDLYRDRASVFYNSPADCFTASVIAINNALNSQNDMKFHYYNWENADDPENTRIYYIKPKGKYRLYHLDEPVYYHNAKDYLKFSALQQAKVKDGDGKVLFITDNFSIKDEEGEIKADNVSTLGIYDETGKFIRNANKNDIQSLIYEWVGAFDHFNSGMMYYFWPAQITSQSCGSVRNAWYKYTLKSISQIGTSVDNPDQPIVPIKVPVNNRLNIKVELIDWHRMQTLLPIL